MNPFTLIKEVYDASQAGQQLANPKTWSNRASIVSTVTVFITVTLAIANQFISKSIDLSPDDVHEIAVGIAAVGLYISNRLHVASNIDAGK